MPRKTISVISSPCRLSQPVHCRAAALGAIAGEVGTCDARGLGRSKLTKGVIGRRFVGGLAKKRSALETIKKLEG